MQEKNKDLSLNSLIEWCKRHKIATFFIVMFVLAVLANNSESTNVSSPEANPEGVVAESTTTEPIQKEEPVVEVIQPDFKVAVQDFLAEAKTNNLAAERKYKGKLVEVSGKVGSIDEDILGKAFVTVEGPSSYEFSWVQCYMSEDSVDKGLTLQSGQSVIVKGEINSVGAMISTIKDCEIL